MKMISPINFQDWIDDNRHLLKPPVGNSVVYDQGDFMIMVVGGPNSRKDYHVDPIEEFFYQLERDMLIKVIIDNKRVEIPIKEGEKLAKIADNVVIKVPLTMDGLKACKSLSDNNIKINVTLCFSAAQALLAAKAGATYISPFIGRLDDIGAEGMNLILSLIHI